MMKRFKTFTVAGVALLLCSCIPSLNPFYTERDVIFDARLLGEWQDQNKSDTPEIWRFEKANGESREDKTYRLTVVEKGKEGTFQVHLFKLKQEWFFDLIPSHCEFATNQADVVGFSMFPGHLLVRTSEPGRELKLAFFDFEWLSKYLKKNPRALSYHTEGKDIILTGETKDLQKFVLKHLAEDELFQKPETFIRKTETPPGGAASR